MSLNIKNERVHDLVRAAAARTGESQTSVVETAVRRYLDDLAHDTRYDEADTILADLQRRWHASDAPPLDIDDLYDPSTGLPA